MRVVSVTPGFLVEIEIRNGKTDEVIIITRFFPRDDVTRIVFDGIKLLFVHETHAYLARSAFGLFSAINLLSYSETAVEILGGPCVSGFFVRVALAAHARFYRRNLRGVQFSFVSLHPRVYVYVHVTLETDFIGRSGLIEHCLRKRGP